jgi:hypothetical protein
LSYQEAFLHAAREHLDDCYLILRTLVDPAAVGTTARFAEDYLIESRLPGAKPFQQSMESYKQSFQILNKLKHQQGRLRGLSLWTDAGAHLGYFLEDPHREGRLGPSPEIHPDRGAISFARDLPWQLFNVYRCSNRLVEAIRKAVATLHGVSIHPGRATDDALWRKAIGLVAAITPRVFPEEVPRNIATFRRSENETMLTIKFPERVQPRFPASMRAVCSWVIDGHCPTFKVPFP